MRCPWVLLALLPSVPAQAQTEVEKALGVLFAEETELRNNLDFAALPPSDGQFGPDPYALVRTGDSVVGLLRGADKVVLLSDAGTRLAHANVVSPSALTVVRDTVWIASDLSGTLHAFRVTGNRLERAGTVHSPARGVRGLAASGGHFAVGSEADGGVWFRGRLHPCPGVQQVRASETHVVANCLLDQSIYIWQRDEGGLATPPTRIQHDGPFWNIVLHEDNLLLATGVEDHPLIRQDGGFLHIDSFAYAYKLTGEKVFAVNTSELGVVTGKGMLVGKDHVWIFAYGSDRAVRLRLADGRLTAQMPIRAGIRAVVATARGWIAANTLTDAWVTSTESRAIGTAPRRPDVLLGETLFFTTAMAPWNQATGPASRFTCETCHFEGYVDGRLHNTGRDNIHVVTKPLLGVFNNRPHFTRALDRTSTDMVHNEFKVANRHGPRAPWFHLRQESGTKAETHSPLELRQALMRFLVRFTHRRSPYRTEAFSARARRGARLFAARCESCHQARLSTDAPKTRLPAARWETVTCQPNAPIVWATDGYQRTGITPYVHEKGARTPSLRRLYKKAPYFTNGSAQNLYDVVSGFRWRGETSFHAAAPPSSNGFSGEEISALVAFLRRL